jgi:hypothetical protein
VNHFARCSCTIAAQTARPGGVAGVRPCDLLDQAELRQLAETWGTQFADCLIADARWPTCNQPAAIHAAGLVVDRAIIGIVAILDSGDDFKPHTAMMSRTIHTAFWSAMPSSSKKENRNAPTS